MEQPSLAGTFEYRPGDIQGSLFKVTPEGEFISLVSFNDSNGRKPSAGLIEGSDGNLYGTTEFGGANGKGTVFKMTPEGELTTVASLGAPHGSSPAGGVVVGSDGNFYGTTQYGGTNNIGTIFRVTPAGELTTIASFDGANGKIPTAELVLGIDGNFYGTTTSGGANDRGAVFKVSPAGGITTLASFSGSNGSNPRAGLVEGHDGNFYGITQSGGANGSGTVFKVTPAGEFTTVISFSGLNGSSPRGGLVEGSDGNLYGTTFYGGANGYGTIFRMSLTGELTVLHSFDIAVASHPEGKPVFGSDGKLYGTARPLVAWRFSVPVGPSALITQPNSITTTGATLTGTVNANAADTIVIFEYGLTPGYGNSIAATQGIVSGTSETPVSATLSGLAPHSIYYYRITATNTNGSTNSAGGSFTTANTPPVAANDNLSLDSGGFGASKLPVLANDSDTDGDLLAIVAVTQGAFGTVTTNGSELTYTPAAGFRGRDTFSYTVSDGLDTATAQVELRVTVPLTRALFSKGSEVPGAGRIDSGISAESLFKSFGVPAINSSGALALTANYAAPRGVSELSILVVEPHAVGSRLIARRGATAPGTQGARFASFKDPLLNDAGEVAFLASLSGGDTTKRNNQGIWLSSPDAANSSGTELVARTGAQPSGVSAGAQWKSFTSVAFSGVGADSDADEGGWSLAFTGFMSTGAGGVKENNDMGLWIARPGKMLLALREAQKLTIDGTERQVRTFATLKPLATAPGQGNGVTSAGGVSVQVFFTDGSQAVLRVSNDGVADEVAIEVLALTGDAVMAAEETIAKPGLPAQSGSGEITAWVGALSGKPAPGAIFERSLGDSGVLRLLARKGDENTGIDGAAFSAFTTVAVNDAGSALFLGKVAGKGTSSTNDNGLWWRQNSDDTSSLQLLAREGAQPPGTPAGTKWSAFTSLALPEGNAGPVFTAKLAGSKGMARQDRVASSNDQGLWAVDSSGELQLVVREGQEVTVDGSTTRKKIKSFTVLSAVPGSSVQRRSFDATGRIVYRAVFTDGSQAVVKVQLP